MKFLKTGAVTIPLLALLLSAGLVGQAHAVDRTITATHVWVEAMSNGQILNDNSWRDPQGFGSKSSNPPFYARAAQGGRSATRTRGAVTAAEARRRAAADAASALFPMITLDDIRIVACSVHNWSTGARYPRNIFVNRWGSVVWTGNTPVGSNVNNEYRAVARGGSGMTEVRCTGTEWDGRPTGAP